jgi:TolA-binding protein
MARSVFPHKDLAKLSYDFVPVIAHGNPDHGEGDFIYGKKKTHLCKIYDVPNCKAHSDMGSELSRRGLLKGVRGTPTHIMFNPHDLSEISRAHGMSVGQIEDAVEDAQKKLGKPIRYKDFQKMRKALDEVKASIEKGDYRKALKGLKSFDAKGLKSLEAEAKKLSEETMDAGGKMIEAAEAALEAGDKKKAGKLLKDVTRHFSGTDLAKKAKSLLDQMKEE